jgi:DMSO/TMAO reductase YedYZ heme-binding membrane subunit
MNFRKLHRKIAPIIFIPLVLSAVTGLIYKLGKNWFGMSSEVADVMMSIHEGRFLGERLVPIYVLLVGMGLLAAIVSGVALLQRTLKRLQSQPKQFTWRSLHGWLSPIVFLPLAITAMTGIAYRLGKDWFGLSNKQASIFMRLHQGSFLSSSLQSVYVLFVGVGLLAMLITGIQMSGILRKRRAI